MTEEQLKRCQRCLRKVGRKWDQLARLDLQEGLCPKKVGKEIYECGVTGKRLPLGRVKIIA